MLLVYRRRDGLYWVVGFFGAVGKMYKLFWCGCQEKTEGVGVLVAEKWVDEVIQIDRHNDGIL